MDTGSQEVHLPDGAVVRGAALASRETNRDWRGWGLYLDARWSPTWPAELIDWPDLGIPTDDVAAADTIRRAHLRAVDGTHVEVGCLGGLGRTGTVLACFAVLAGIPSDDAVAWVRRAYAPFAVESSAQEAWVLWFAEHAWGRGWIHGNPG